MLLLLATASAADLDVSIKTSTGVDTHVTFRDIENHAPPALLLRDDMRLDITPEQVDGRWQLAFRLSEVNSRGRARLVSAPVLLVETEQEGMVRHGSSAAAFTEITAIVHVP